MDIHSFDSGFIQIMGFDIFMQKFNIRSTYLHSKLRSSSKVRQTESRVSYPGYHTCPISNLIFFLYESVVQYHKCVQYARFMIIQNIFFSTAMFIRRNGIVLRSLLRKYCIERESSQSVTLI